jgi:ribonuclease D
LHVDFPVKITVHISQVIDIQGVAQISTLARSLSYTSLLALLIGSVITKVSSSKWFKNTQADRTAQTKRAI